MQEERLRAGRAPDEPGFGEEPRERWGVLAAGEQTETVPTEPGCYLDFYRAIAAGGTPVDPAGAVATLAVLEAARRSAAEHAVVRL